MRRDMDLIRNMLIASADADHPIAARGFVDDSHSRDLVAYHFDLLAQAGLADVGRTEKDGCFVVADEIYLMNPTWEGNEFVDAVRNPSVWHRVKRRIEHTVGSATFGTWKSLAVKIASNELDG